MMFKKTIWSNWVTLLTLALVAPPSGVLSLASLALDTLRMNYQRREHSIVKA